MNEVIYDNELKEFEERSDYINESDLEMWNVEIQHFKDIQKKLLSSGIKLLVGPRGTGKTHQMKLCYKKCKEDNTGPFCIYISFSKYYFLEPYLTKTSNAIQIFHSWVLGKIILSCIEYLEETDNNSFISEINNEVDLAALKKFIIEAERSLIEEESESLLRELSISLVVNIIDKLTDRLSRKRAIILLDDAALTLTPDYLIEFFDIIRSIKTKSISPKASVYPGTTEYGPRFHIGHDAEEIPCWLDVRDDRYSEFMNELISKRFSNYITEIKEEIIELFKYASFGIPRSFISLLSNYSNHSNGSSQQRFNKVLERQAELIKTEYLSLSQKLPQYKKVIQIGMSLFDRTIELLKEENQRLPPNQKNILIGIPSEDLDRNNLYKRLIQFLNEAGLFYDKGSVSHGEGRLYTRYSPHMLFLIENKSFSGKSRGFNPKVIITKLKAKSVKHPLRKTIDILLTEAEINDLGLDLPNCQNCGAKRIAEEQKFCHICGTELINKSTFESCLKIPVDQLLLTEWQKNKIKQNGFEKIKDFLTQKDPASELRKIHNIGKKRAEQITEEVQRFIEEFLT